MIIYHVQVPTSYSVVGCSSVWCSNPGKQGIVANVANFSTSRTSLFGGSPWGHPFIKPRLTRIHTGLPPVTGINTRKTNGCKLCRLGASVGQCGIGFVAPGLDIAGKVINNFHKVGSKPTHFRQNQPLRLGHEGLSLLRRVTRG